MHPAFSGTKFNQYEKIYNMENLLDGPPGLHYG
jgi:hypothetical protein